MFSVVVRASGRSNFTALATSDVPASGGASRESRKRSSMKTHQAATVPREGCPAAGMRLSNGAILAIVAAWGLLVAVGLCALWRYVAAPGESGAPPVTWPAQSQVNRDGKPTLLFFAHPMCPCTLASLSELERLAAVCHDGVDIQVLFIAPDGTDDSWRESGLYAIARRIPGVKAHTDASRRETELFRARTSGTCLLYDRDGRLLFHGGLTAARGHEGDNEGSRSIKAILMGKDVQHYETSVFGCPLFENETGTLSAKCCPE